ncbi:hypothetical protein EJ08DRAFT_653001 [Tothia fuscella]|uniref:Uncharacterized protein n=1 Tax=Tothia fuscella TaxID=1048955 RepID=A0A9P4TUH8_9PEZI|nr:hypothetical protein EJ08DRAFT_653001 [Tothia fuscella]
MAGKEWWELTWKDKDPSAFKKYGGAVPGIFNIPVHDSASGESISGLYELEKDGGLFRQNYPCTSNENGFRGLAKFDRNKDKTYEFLNATGLYALDEFDKVCRQEQFCVQWSPDGPRNPEPFNFSSDYNGDGESKMGAYPYQSCHRYWFNGWNNNDPSIKISPFVSNCEYKNARGRLNALQIDVTVENGTGRDTVDCLWMKCPDMGPVCRDPQFGDSFGVV